MPADDKSIESNRRDAIFTGLLTAAVSWGAIVFFGYLETPPYTYNEIFGNVVPLCVFGFIGFIAGVLIVLSTLAICWPYRVSPFTSFWRLLAVIVIAICICKLAVYLGVRHMVLRPPPYGI